MKDWIDFLPLAATLQVLEDLGTKLATPHMSRPVIAELLGFIRDRNYLALVNYELDYSTLGPEDVEWVRVARQLLGFYQKLENLELGVDKERTAYEKWVAAEKACRETNLFLRAVRCGNAALTPQLATVLYRARDQIARALGPCPSIGQLRLSFGPGATTTVKKEEACPQTKLAELPSCSENLLHSGLLPSLMRELPHWLDCHAEEPLERWLRTGDLHPVVDHEGYEVDLVNVCVTTSQLFFVPKNAKIYRSIMLQPTLDTLLQKGIGLWLQARLLRVGVDIRDQKRNQRLAGAGSLHYEDDAAGLATIDLSSASDTISLELVKFLVPEDWYALLKACRPCSTTYRKHEYQLEQFSAMGNGFTFPLETLIFWGLCRACLIELKCNTHEFDAFSVYGDDIIVPSRAVAAVLGTLRGCGFTVNTKKSYVSGPFRESCGSDYLWGCDIRPFYQKTLVSGETLFTLHNFFFRRWCFDMAEAVLAHIPEWMRIYGPDGYGDGHLLTERSVGYRNRQVRRWSWSGFLFDTYKRIGRERASLYPGDYVTPLYCVYQRERPMPSEAETLREYARQVAQEEPGNPERFLGNGRWVYDLPDTDGYERVSIYTLVPV